MLIAGIAFFTGTLLALQLAELPNISICTGLAAFASGILFIRWLRPVAIAILGFAWASLYAHWQLHHTLPENLEGETITVIGRIAGLPEDNANRVRFLFDVETVKGRDTSEFTPLRVRLNWYSSAPALTVGDRWKLSVRLKRPRGFSNPGGFDYERWLFANRIRATGYVYAKGGHELLESSAGGYRINRLRQWIASRIELATARASHSGTMRALSIGDRSQIDREQWRRLVDTGTNHLFAISGLHIGLVAALSFWLGSKLWRSANWLQRLISRQRFAVGLALGCGLWYAAMAGFALPTQRALIMLMVPAAALLLERRVSISLGLGTALLLVLVFDPLAPMSAGFWLSFAAVAIILVRLGGRITRQSRWKSAVGLQLALSIGLIPLLIVQFAQVPVVSVVANIVAVPWLGLVVVPATLVGAVLATFTTTLSAWVFTLADYAIGAFWFFLQTLYSLDILMPVTVRVSTLGVGLLFVAVAALLLPRGGRAFTLAMVLAMPAVLGDALTTEENEQDLQVQVLDVGQGLAVLVVIGDRLLVYDTGHRFSPTFNAGAAVVVPAIRALGFTSIDVLMISHMDLDHRGGMKSLLDAFPVRRILSGEPGPVNAPYELCSQGQQWRWGNAQFDVLSPALGYRWTRRNDRSCVLKITIDGSSVLLPGDIERDAEQALVESELDLSADILVAPHHGSATSSTNEFLARVQPDYVIYPVGFGNRFGFPDPEVVRRFTDRDVEQWRTDRDGAVIFAWDAGRQRWSAYSYRNKVQRFWNDNRHRTAFTAAVE